MTAEEVLDWIAATGRAEVRAELARYGIPDTHAVGIPMREMKAKAKAIGRDTALARALWASGGYEARTIAAHIADPVKLGAAELDAWAGDLDNWALCDTAAFQLFDKAPARWDRARAWCGDDRLYVRRAGFATVWGMSVHEKTAADTAFLEALDWIEAAAGDTRDHVRKGVSMALRAVGKRNRVLHGAALGLAEELAARTDPAARKTGREAVRDLSSPATRRRVGA